jgi:hypothetical protein
MILIREQELRNMIQLHEKQAAVKGIGDLKIWEHEHFEVSKH